MVVNKYVLDRIPSTGREFFRIMFGIGHVVTAISCNDQFQVDP